MITVGGFNPAIDRLLEVDELRPGTIVRAGVARSDPGGKGLHVACAVAALGSAVRLVGPMDERHARWFEEFLAERGVEQCGVPVGGALRTCVALKERDGRLTEILEPGPELDLEARTRLLSRFIELCAGVSVAVVSGSLPRGVPADTYGTLADALGRRGIPCLVDASGPALRNAAAARPFLLKGNRDEMADLVGEAIDGPRAAAAVARRLGAGGIPRVVVTLGSEGAVAFWQGRVLHVAVSVPRVVNTVGSGDCFLAGLAVAIERGADGEEALRLAVACGAAKATSAETGFLRREVVEALAPLASVTELP